MTNGADVNAAARHSGTPLDVAWEGPDRDFAAWLESKGARATPLRFDVTTITRAVHRLAFPWGMMNNVLVFSGTDGAVVVDSGFSRRAVDELRKTILGWSPQGVRYVVNSHPHGDHVAGNALAPTPAAVITAGDAGRPARRAGDHAAERAAEGPDRADAAGRLRLADRRRGTHAASRCRACTPRPTSSSTSPGESVVAMGDLLLSESPPAVNDLAAYLSFLDDVLDVFPENTTFVSGHGRDLTPPASGRTATTCWR